MAGNEILKRLPVHRPQNEREWNEFLLNLSLAVGDLVEFRTSTLIDESRLPEIIDQIRIPMEITANRGAVQNILPLSAEDLGGSVGCKIVVAAHYCLHGNRQVDYDTGEIGDDLDPLPYSTGAGDVIYYVYIDNPDYENLLSNYQVSTDFLDTMAAGRYYVGQVTMPADGDPPVSGGGGGGGGVAPPADPLNGGVFP